MAISDSPRLFHGDNLSSGTAENRAVCLGPQESHLAEASVFRSLLSDISPLKVFSGIPSHELCLWLSRFKKG